MLENVVKDKYDRPILSLRITLTNRCNVNCIYCHHDGMRSSKNEMTPDEIYKICQIAKRIGVRKIRLSGGEPLIRKDIVEIVSKISSIGFNDISITTNGILLEKYAKNRKVLNMFCYTGGFSFYAMRGGAELVHSVDSSAKAIDLTKKNVEMNFPNDERHEAYVRDAFKYLDEMGDNYDLIILDPPAFAKHRNALHNALQGYKRLNAKAFEKITEGKVVFDFNIKAFEIRW